MSRLLLPQPRKPTLQAKAKEPFLPTTETKTTTMILYIKNMVCNRCKMVVKLELENLGYNPLNISLGEVTLEKELTCQEKATIDKTLQLVGFSIIDDKKSRLIEKIKTLIVELRG